jgi:hypothetical protein
MIVGMAAVLLLVLAPPASAHGTGGSVDAPASNYRSRITSVVPEIPGITWSVIDAGTRLEVVNRTKTALVVMGDGGEPFLRIGPAGVEENTRSITAFRLANPNPSTPIPQEVLEGGTPRWRDVSSSPSYAWHDDRAHWTDADPPAVRADPSATTVVVPEWTVEAQWDGAPLTVKGDVTWVPGPSVWPSVLAVLVLGLGLAALGWARLEGWALVAAATLSVVSSGLVEVGVWWASAASGLTKVERFLMPALAWMLLAAALVRYRSVPRDAVLLAAGAATGIAVLIGTTGWQWFGHSQLPTALDPWLGRAAVIAALGSGLGMLGVAAASWLRAGEVRPAPAVSRGPAAP